MTATTLSDLENPTTLSGYRHVNVHPDDRRSKRYRAQIYRGHQNRAGHSFIGPWRILAVEAAQDYLDHKAGVMLAGQVQVVRARKPAEGWFDVVKEQGNEFIDTPPSAALVGTRRRTFSRRAPEREFMLSERFQKAVHALPANCVAEAKASASLSALQYATGQVLVKRALRGLDDLAAYVIVPVEPHPDHRAAVESLGVEIIVP